MLDKKQIWAIFLFEFKIGHKAVEITHNINNALAQKLLMNIQCSGGSRSFVKETRASIKDEEHSGWPSEVHNDQLRAIIEADPLTTTWEVAQKVNVSHSTVTWHLKQIKKVKRLDKWLPSEPTTN